MHLNWISAKAEVRPTPQAGHGVFVVAPVQALETVVCFGGYAVDGHTLAGLPAERRRRSMQVDTDLFLVSAEGPEPGDMVNHSCEPSCGLVGSVVLVARRALAVGEELTFDYATSDSAPYDEFDCRCGAPGCRGRITASDWMRPDVQAQARGWFSPYLQRRLDARQAVEPGR